MSLLLLLVIFVEVESETSCPSQFELKSDCCVKRVLQPITLFNQCELCTSLDASVITLKDFMKLRGSVSGNEFYTTRSNYLLTGSRQAIVYDAKLGFVHSSYAGIQFTTTPNYGNILNFVQLSSSTGFTSHITHQRNVACIKNKMDLIKDVYRFVEGFEGQTKVYHSVDGAKEFAFAVEADSSRTICLAKCAKNKYCSAAYFSESTRRCSLRLYMDTFLHEDDREVATDFQRYAIYR